MDNSKEFQLMLDKAIEAHPIDFATFDRTQNLQDQLQGMVDMQLTDLLTAFDCFRYDDFRIRNGKCQRRFFSIYAFQFTSMEQLWMAFVMKENYGKIWNGEDWIEG